MTVSLVQYSPVWEDVPANLSRLSSVLQPLKGKTDLILLPEMFATGFSTNTDVICSEKNHNLASQWMRDTALSTGAMVAGGVAVEVKKKFYNRFYWYGKKEDRESEENKEISGYYDKNYLFSMSDEPKYFTAGKEKKQFKWGGMTIRPIVCYDLRFPELCRNTREDPYDILVCAASWPSARSDVWLTLLKARAIENQCHAIGVNRVGTDGNGTQHKGDSIIYGPRGNVIIHLPENEEIVATAEACISDVFVLRKTFPVLNDIKK